MDVQDPARSVMYLRQEPLDLGVYNVNRILIVKLLPQQEKLILIKRIVEMMYVIIHVMRIPNIVPRRRCVYV